MMSATLARILARRGRRVLAVDLDPNPGLAWSLGLGPDDIGLLPTAVAPREGALYGWGLAPDVVAATGAELYSTDAPDGVRYLSGYKVDRADSLHRHTVSAIREILDATDRSWDVVGDLEAGTTSAYGGDAGFADAVVVMVTPSWRSGLAARRLCALLPDVKATVVANRYQDQADHPGLSAAVRVIYDPAIVEAERCGLAPLDACPGSPMTAAVAALADLLVGGAAA